jgi:VanZ family protein
LGRLLLLTAALVVYASLYPFDFTARDSLEGLLRRWPAGLDRFALRDIGINLLAYVPVGWFAFLTLAKSTSRPGAVLYSAELGAALSIVIEIAQYFERTRVSSSLDVMCNTAGAALGASLAALVGGAAVQAARRSGIALSAPAALLAAWAAHLVFPPVPAIGFTRIARRWSELAASGPPEFLATAAGAVCWLAAARLIEAAGVKRVRIALALMMMLAPARLLLAGPPLRWSDIAAPVAAFALWPALERVPKKSAILAALAVAAITVSGLAPFQFAEPHGFSWLPFRGTLDSERTNAAVVLFEKTFIYGAALWLMRDAGLRLRTAAGVLLPLVAALEAAQVYLPGRTAEITDPLLVALLAFALARTKRAGATAAGG